MYVDELGPYQQLAIIATALAVLALAFLVIVCLVSPYCWCHRFCPCAPRYPGEVYDKGPKKFNPDVTDRNIMGTSLNRLPIYKGPDYKILSETEGDRDTSKRNEETPLAKSELRRYDSVTSAAEVTPDYRRYYSRKPVKSLEIEITWDHREGTATIRFKTLHLTRVKRRKGITVHAAVVTDRRSTFSRPWNWGRGTEITVAEHSTEIQEQTAQVNLNETMTVDWVVISGRGTLRINVHAAEGGIVTDVIGKAELPLQELDSADPKRIRLYLTSPQPVIKGSCRVSLCYLPTAEKLSVVIDDCSLDTHQAKQSDEIYIQISLIYKNHALGKRKTSMRRSPAESSKGDSERPTLANLSASHQFDLPPDRLSVVCLLLNFKRPPHDGSTTDSASDRGVHSADTASEILSEDEQSNADSLPYRDVGLGSVIIGLESGLPDAQAHWSEMIATPRAPLVRYHHIL